MIDSHFHIWRQADLPWLQGPSAPRIFGEYDGITRDYPIAEYLSDAQDAGVTSAVYVQTNWPREKSEGEVAWVSQTAQGNGWPMGIAGYADMTLPDARPILDRLARYPLIKGIRQKFPWHEKPTYRFAAEPDICLHPNVQANVTRLADYGLSFDLHVFCEQMDSAAALACACPRTTFVLQHAGMLEDTSAAGRDIWRRSMATLASEPNIYAKLSGFGTFLHRNDPAHISWLINETVALFGAKRCLWGSNFPIEKLWTAYAPLLDAHRQDAGGLSSQEQTDIFHNTAARIYRLTSTQ